MMKIRYILIMWVLSGLLIDVALAATTLPSVTTSNAWHSCGVTAQGAAYCWGYNVDGQLGDGTDINSNVPVAVSGGATFQSVDAGGWHSCGMASDGVAYCWGNNSRGTLGDGTTIDHG